MKTAREIDEMLRNVRGPIERYLQRRMSHSDSQEAVAETMRVLWTKSDEVPEGQEVAWGIGVARKIAANMRRGELRRENLARKIAENSLRTHQESVALDLSEAMGRLEESDRELLRLWAWEGLEAADIAIIEDCSANTAAARLSRARKRLRAELTDTSRLPR